MPSSVQGTPSAAGGGGEDLLQDQTPELGEFLQSILLQ